MHDVIFTKIEGGNRPLAPYDDYHEKLMRNKLLATSDWTQLPDVPLATKEAWATYRQALRDITKQPGFPLKIDWPIPPEG